MIPEKSAWARSKARGMPSADSSFARLTSVVTRKRGRLTSTSLGRICPSQPASRVAVSELPVPVDAVGRIVGADEATATASLEACVAFGLVQRFDEPDAGANVVPLQLG